MDDRGKGSVRAGLEEHLKEPGPHRRPRDGSIHPFLANLWERFEIVRLLAEQAQENGHADLIGFTPQEMDRLYRPTHDPFSTVVQWRLDDGRRVPVLIVVQRHTGDEDAPSKGGIRAVLHRYQVDIAGFDIAWKSVLRDHPPDGTASRRVLLQDKLGELAGSEMAQALAMLMSKKLALGGLQEVMGGGKGVIMALHVDDQGRILEYKPSYSQEELIRLARGVGRVLAEAGVMDPKVYVPAGDVGTERMVPYFAEEFLKRKVRQRDPEFLNRFSHPSTLNRLARKANGRKTPLLQYVAVYSRRRRIPMPELAAVTSKPPGLGGSEGRADSNGWVSRFVAEELARMSRPDRAKLDRPLEGLTFVTQGWGAVGQPVTRLMTEAGAKAIAFSDAPGRYLDNPKGFTLPELAVMMAYRREKGNGPLGRNPDMEIAEMRRRGVSDGVQFLEPQSELLTLETDFLVPAATEGAIDGKNAGQVHARLGVVPIANGAVTADGYRILAERGIPVTPDTLASIGGVIASWFEMEQNKRGEHWTEEEVVGRLREVVRRGMQEILDMKGRLRALDSRVDLLTAADAISYRRLVERFVRPAGLEEGDFPPPERITTPPAKITWDNGGDVLPSRGERLARMAFQSPPGGARQYLRLFASLNVGDLPQDLREAYQGKPLLDHLPSEQGLESGYLGAETVEPYVRSRIKRVLRDWGPRVRARVRLGRTDVGIPMRPINVWKDGRIRFEGRVPAEDQRFLVDRSFSVEIFWKGRWYRLREEGRIRIEPPNPAQVAAQPDDDVVAMGERDAQDELRMARGLLDEEMDEAVKQEKRVLTDMGVVTAQNLPWEHRSRYLGELEKTGRLTPADARRAFVGQQIAAGVQKKGFFNGMQFKLWVSPSGQRTLIMYNPNRAHTPRPLPGASHPLSEERPSQFKLPDGRVEILKQRARPVNGGRLADNPLKEKVNPFGYVPGHVTLPVTHQIPQEEWSQGLAAVTEEMWRQAERLAVIGVNFGAKAAASLPDWAHAHDIPWRVPVDEAGDGEIRWLAIRDGVRIGLLRDPHMTTFVFEGEEASQDRMIEEAGGLLAQLRERGAGQVNAWGAVRSDGVGRLYITPRNPVEPEPPADPALREKWKPADDYAKPLADQDYWFVELAEGQYELMGQAEMERLGLRPVDRHPVTHRPLPPGPHVPHGRPVLDIKMGIMELRRYLLVSQLNIYEDPFLEARLAKSYELVGLSWQDARIRALVEQLKPAEYADSESDREVHEALESSDQIRTAEDLMDLVERISGWRTRHVQAFHRLSGPERDRFNWKMEALVERFTREQPDLVREIPGPRPAKPAAPDAGAGLRDLVAVNLNPALDRGLRLVVEDGERHLETWSSTGTSPANIAQASAILGRPSRLHGLMEGPTGEKAAAALRAYGVDPWSLTSDDSPVGSPTRVTLLVTSSRPGRRERRLVGQGEPLPEEFVGRLPALLGERLPEAATPPSTLAVGERLVGPHALEVAQALAAQVVAAQRAGNRASVSANRSWDLPIWEKFLAARPPVLSVPMDAFAAFLDAQEGVVEYREDLLKGRPGEIAAAADRHRRQHGIQEWLVSMGAAGVVLVTDEGWWHVVPSPVIELTYLNGAADVTDAAYLLERSKDRDPLDSLVAGITASTLFMEEDGRVPTLTEVEEHLFRAQVNVLPRPVAAAGLEEAGIAAPEREAVRQLWEVEVEEAAGLPYGRIFHHEAVPVPDFWKQAAWGTYVLPGDVLDADRTLAATLSEVPVSPADIALVAPGVVSAEPGEWDGLLREHRLAGVQVTPEVMAKLSDPALAAAFLKQIQRALAQTGGLVIVTDVKIETGAQGARRLLISA